MTHNTLAAFHWRDDPRPSIFMSGRSFVPNVNGESMNHVATRTVQAFEQRTGRSQGTVAGISVAADRAIDDSRHLLAQRRKARAA